MESGFAVDSSLGPSSSGILESPEVSHCITVTVSEMIFVLRFLSEHGKMSLCPEGSMTILSMYEKSS